MKVSGVFSQRGSPITTDHDHQGGVFVRKALLWLLPLAFGLAPGGVADEVSPNVLIVYVDDLNMDIGPEVSTPNLDRLRTQGVDFQQAYCPFPVCGPSRIAFMSGQRASSTWYFSNDDPFPGEAMNGVPFLPQKMSLSGYRTGGAGKVFHRLPWGMDGLWDEFAWESHDEGIPYPENPIWMMISSSISSRSK